MEIRKAERNILLSYGLKAPKIASRPFLYQNENFGNQWKVLQWNEDQIRLVNFGASTNIVHKKRREKRNSLTVSMRAENAQSKKWSYMEMFVAGCGCTTSNARDESGDYEWNVCYKYLAAFYINSLIIIDS